MVVMVMVVTFLWVWYVEIDHWKSMRVRHRMTRSRFDIVLAYYAENPHEVRQSIELIKSVPAIAELDPRVIVYAKGPLDSFNDPYTQLDDLRQRIGADIIRALPNRGQEGDTYLTHIIDHHNYLADHTLFARAVLDEPDGFLPRLFTHFNASVGVMSLSTHSSCNCELCQPDWEFPERRYIQIPQLYAVFNEEFCPADGLLITYRGQFIVSRDRILRKSKEKFIWLRSILNDISHFVHEDLEEEDQACYVEKNAVDDPYFGQTLERFWMVMFGCNKVSIATECDDGDPSTPCGCYD
jgi:hypothetical protein